jgi:putative ABC transport system ATP-binding protein
MPHIVELEEIRKSYVRGTEHMLVLDHLSLHVEAGEFFALMGPSGSGKTTLLNIMAGIDRADSGTVRVAGADLNTLNEDELARWRSRTVGFVFQFYNLIPVLSALENVALPLALLPLSAKERRDRAAFALEVVGLVDRADHRPGQLSGGQEQRVAIARAIVTDPQIVVADEPTGDLDRTSATEILELLSRLNREYKKTIAMVTHDEAAARYAAHIIRLDKGKLIRESGEAQ